MRMRFVPLAAAVVGLFFMSSSQYASAVTIVSPSSQELKITGSPDAPTFKSWDVTTKNDFLTNGASLANVSEAILTIPNSGILTLDAGLKLNGNDAHTGTFSLLLGELASVWAFHIGGGPGGGSFIVLSFLNAVNSVTLTGINGPTGGGISGVYAYNLSDPINLTAVPLPAALPLFASGLGALGLLGWRRRKKKATIA